MKDAVLSYIKGTPTKPTVPNPELTPEQIAERERQEVAAQKRRDLEAKILVWESLMESIGPRYQNARFANFECQHPGQQNALDALVEYAKDYPQRRRNGAGIVLTGPCGTGKDFSLIALAHDVLARHCAGREKNTEYFGMTEITPTVSISWLNGSRFFSELRDGMDNNDFDEQGYLKHFIKTDVLILSDPVPPLGQLTPYQASMLYMLVDSRYCYCRPTWVTLNVGSAAEAIERLTAPIIDRLKHGALCINCNWPSYRKAGQNVITQ